VASLTRPESQPLLASLSDEEYGTLADHVELRDVESGHHAVHQGDGGYTFFIIKSGAADVVVDDAIVRSLQPGDYLGEMAILGQGRRTATVTATSPMELVALFGLEFRRLQSDHPELAEKIRSVMVERLA